MTSQPVSAQYGRAAQKTHSDLKELSETSFLACSGMRPWFERRLLSPQIESNIVRCPDPEAAERMITAIDAVRTRGDSCGGVVTCIARGVPKVSARGVVWSRDRHRRIKRPLVLDTVSFLVAVTLFSCFESSTTVLFI